MAASATLPALSASPKEASTNQPASTEKLVLPHGFSLTPPKGMDVTFQVLPFYDEKEEVLAVWSGEELQYFAALTRMPPGWTDAEDYFRKFQRDLSAAVLGPVTVGRKIGYQAVEALRGQSMELFLAPNTEASNPHQVVHFLTDGSTTFVAFAKLVQLKEAGALLSSSVKLFKTAALQSAGAQPASESTPYSGLWAAQLALPDGRTLKVEWNLKPDLTFSTGHMVGHEVYWVATGVWEVSGKELLSTYMYSKPELPAHAKKDVDEIQAFDGTTLTLRSKRTGRVSTFVRQSTGR